MRYKSILFGTMILSTTLFTTGCSIQGVGKTMEDTIASIPIPFSWFKDDAKSEKSVEIKKVQGLNLSKEKVPTKRIETISDNLIQISKILSNKNYFQKIVNGESDIFQLLSSQYLDLHFDIENDGLTNTIKEFGKTPYQYIDSLTLREYGTRLASDGQKNIYAVVDVNGVNDTEKFHIQSLLVTLTPDGHIASTEMLDNTVDQLNTRTPLTENSILNNDTHLEFQQQIEKTILALSNPKIYSKIKLKEINSNDTAIQALTKQIGVKNNDASTIFHLVKQGKGEFKYWGITGYLFDDNNVEPITYYELVVSDEEGYHYYTVSYHRGKEKIVDIKEGSPFKEGINDEK